MKFRGWMIAVSLGAATLFSASAATAAPLISGCSNNGNNTQTCNFYETDANGLPSEISSPVVNLFSSTTDYHPGYSAINDPNGTLSDIIVWTAETGTLHSCDDGALPNNCNTAGLTLLGVGTEDSNGDLLGATKARFLISDDSRVGPDFINVFSPVPEPVTLSLVGAGLVGAVAMRRRKKKTA